MKHVLIVSLGPVQDFIAQARRMRDLWFASHLLSELSKAAAQILAANGAQLVFPALDANAKELQPCSGPFDSDGRPVASVANRISAITREGASPEELARIARQAALTRLHEIADDVRNKCDEILSQQVEGVWKEQIDTLVEFAAAWVPLYSDDNYGDARAEAEAHLSSRKALRDFRPWNAQQRPVPKSSFDGARESVLRTFQEAGATATWKRLRISSGEHLDAIGLLKRAGGTPEQFVPLGNITLARWLLHASSTCPRELAQVSNTAGGLGLPKLSARSEWVRAFPWDAGVCRPERLKSIFRELGTGDAEHWRRTYLDALLRQMPRQPSYVACIAADGDSIGEAISNLGTAQSSREFGRGLARFATHARFIVEADGTCGVLVYSGGDDILAFTPVEDALPCANLLRRAFAESVPAAHGRYRPPTMSVGVAAGHYMDNMGHLLELARAAKDLAKGPPRSGGKNALCVLVEKRSGGALSWRAPWTAFDGDPVSRLEKDRLLVRLGRMSVGKVHEIGRILRSFPRPGTHAWADRTWRDTIVADTLRALRRAESPLGPADLSEAEAGLDLGSAYEYDEAYAVIQDWVQRLLIAKEIEDSSVPSSAVGGAT